MSSHLSRSPDATRDPRGYGAATRQCDIWEQDVRVTVTLRTLAYPRGWPDKCEPGEKPREKGIDVALAIDFVAMAVRGEYDVGILMSTDTDLKPALAVADLTGRGRSEAGCGGVERHGYAQPTSVDQVAASLVPLGR